jgi:hypothetical protein
MSTTPVGDALARIQPGSFDPDSYTGVAADLIAGATIAERTGGREPALSTIVVFLRSNHLIDGNHPALNTGGKNYPLHPAERNPRDAIWDGMFRGNRKVFS